MPQDLVRRLRSLEILDDLQTLSDLGMAVDTTAGENQRLMLETYRHHARVVGLQLHEQVGAFALQVEDL